MNDGYIPKLSVNIILIGEILSAFPLRMETYSYAQKPLYITTNTIILEILVKTEGKKEK